MPHKDKAVYRAYQAAYKKANWRRIRDAEREEYRAYMREYGKRNRAKIAVYERLSGAKYRSKIREELIMRYGGKCACCGESELPFLTFDHIVPRSTLKIQKLYYPRLANKPIDPNLQILCFNCNMAKRTYSHCPHRLSKS